jgi:hypothetical protein
MTGDQSRLLNVGDRVRWKDSATDLGTITATAWSEVTISWDNGHTASIQHNDMTQVERGPGEGLKTLALNGQERPRVLVSDC